MQLNSTQDIETLVKIILSIGTPLVLAIWVRYKFRNSERKDSYNKLLALLAKLDVLKNMPENETDFRIKQKLFHEVSTEFKKDIDYWKENS